MRPGQQMIGDLQDGQARQGHVAETMRSAFAVDRLDRREEYRPMIGQQCGKFRGLINPAIENRKIVRHLLKAKLRSVRDKLAELQKLEIQLAADLRKCERTLRSGERARDGCCPVLNEIADAGAFPGRGRDDG